MLAALLIGLSVGAGCFFTEDGVLSAVRSHRLQAVRETLRRAGNLVSERERVASREAPVLAARTDVQQAFVQRDVAPLVALARSHRTVGFRLWNGKLLGSAGRGGPSVAVTVYNGGTYEGQVIVTAQPDSALLDAARKASPATHLAFTVAAKIAATSPTMQRRSLSDILRHGVRDQLTLSTTNGPRAQIYGWRAGPTIPLRTVWPVLAALLATFVAFRVVAERESRRRAKPPPNTVRDAVALVGETLAATHNPQALLPVILRAAVEATDAVGGVITAGDVILETRGTTPSDPAETLEVALEVSEGQSATMRLFPPAGGFGVDARDAAAWIAEQALIALENARLHGQVQRQAMTDELTGLANRRRFLSRLDAELARSRRSGLPLGLVLSDLDDFKRVNDTYGHAVGDEVLRRYSEIVQASVRDIDLPVRLGGEEFAVLLPDTDLAGAAELAERLRRALESATLGDPPTQIRLTASFGVSCFPAAASAEDLLVDADRRLYDAKRQGKNTVVASRRLRSARGR